MLKDPAYRQKLAEATTAGILDTLGMKMKSSVRYKITIGNVDDEGTAQKVVAKLAELGIQAKIEEVST